MKDEGVRCALPCVQLSLPEVPTKKRALSISASSHISPESPPVNWARQGCPVCFWRQVLPLLSSPGRKVITCGSDRGQERGLAVSSAGPFVHAYLYVLLYTKENF